MRYHPTRNSAAWHLLAQVGTWHTALSGRDTARGETRARPGCYARAEQRFRPMWYHPTRIFSARCFGKRGCGQLDRTMLIEVSMAGEPSASAIGDVGRFTTARGLRTRQARMLPSGASFDLGSRSGAQTSAQLPEPRRRRLRPSLRRLCGDRQARISRVSGAKNALVRPRSCLKSGGLYLRVS